MKRTERGNFHHPKSPLFFFPGAADTPPRDSRQLGIRMALGMALGRRAFGMALGRAFGMALGRAFGMALGRAFGMALGRALGTLVV